MANEKQLAFLKASVPKWTAWWAVKGNVEVDLSGANLREADLSGADLRDANLIGADLRETNLRGADFTDIGVGYTVFANLELRSVKGLETIRYYTPSTLGTDTLTKSAGSISEAFLRGCGLSDWEIEMTMLYNPDLSNEQRNQVLYRIYDLQASQAIQISPLFISYSHGDSAFADKIGDCLTKRGIRYWRDIHDMKAGRIETQIDRAIRQNPTVLLILSKNSLNSDWVQHEVRMARDEEKKSGRDVLCPIALDPSWNSEANQWPERIMEQIMEYSILDFSNWHDDSKFDTMFRKLINGLELFYKG